MSTNIFFVSKESEKQKKIENDKLFKFLFY